MTDYTEIVKALRCELHYTSCPETNCKYICHDKFCDTYRLMIDAADAIEDMAKHITEMHERVTVLQIARGELESEVKQAVKRNAELHAELERWVSAAEKAWEPKQGEWIDHYDEDDKPFFKRKYVCSACGGWNTYGKSKYCPNCGAKMEAKGNTLRDVSLFADGEWWKEVQA